MQQHWDQIALDVDLDRFGIQVVVGPIHKVSVHVTCGLWSTRKPTLTSSKGALPRQTAPPLAAPAIRLVTATSTAFSPVNKFNLKSIHGRLTMLVEADGEDGKWSTRTSGVGVLVGMELRIRLVDV